MHPRRLVLPIAAMLCAGLVSCGGDGGPPGQPESPVIAPGVGIGRVNLGMRYQELSALHGEMSNAIVDGRVAVGGYPDQGLDIVLSSPEPTSLAPDAVVIGVGVKTASFAGFPRPGLARAEIEAALGPAPIKAGSIEYYPVGVSVDYQVGTGGDTAKAVGVVPPFSLAPTPPEMAAAKTRGGGQ